MKMNAGIWIGIVGGIVGMLAGIIAVLTTTGTGGIYIATGMLLLFGGMFFLFYKLFFEPIMLAKRLQKEGVAGKALIKEVKDTGVTINNNPQVKVLLEVKNYLGQTYTVTKRVVVSRLQPGLYQPGMTVPVLIDPKNENKLIIDFSGEAQAGKIQSNAAFINPALNTAALKLELELMQKDGDQLRLSGKAARAIIKTYTWLGIYVNGNNPYTSLEIEVLPDNAPAFKAIVKGVMQEQSVGKYQPGHEIFVKYDPNDLSKVTIDHS